jgi:hypothetical protein
MEGGLQGCCNFSFKCIMEQKTHLLPSRMPIMTVRPSTRDSAVKLTDSDFITTDELIKTAKEKALK